MNNISSNKDTRENFEKYNENKIYAREKICIVDDSLWVDCKRRFDGIDSFAIKSNGKVVFQKSKFGSSNPVLENKINSLNDVISIRVKTKGLIHPKSLLMILYSSGKIEVIDNKGNSVACPENQWCDIVAIDTDDNRSIGLKKDGTVVYLSCPAESDELRTKALQKYDSKKTEKDKKSLEAVWTLKMLISGNFRLNSFFPDWNNVVEVCAALDCYFGLKRDGTVVSNSAVGFFDDIKYWQDIVMISGGLGFLAGLKKDGSVVLIVPI